MSHTEVKPEAMFIRFYTPEDHATICKWAERHGLAPLPEKVPPLSVIAHRSPDDKRPVSFACLYMDNGGTGVAFMEWLIVDPDALRSDAMRAVDSVVSFLKAEAAALDYGTVFAFMRHPALARLAQSRHGFQKQWDGVISMAATTLTN